ncbi:hypothetical protein EVAR_29629_1 [Eumeta japonica]|uniref:Uncharacterized protein n=1 Tax=Eumeta variegata TaxID=151549 RepID=A0A4C1WA55_EUMVA|nr:hypothetical protein EVAR_29629_1 [Eumeta japonica]
MEWRCIVEQPMKELAIGRVTIFPVHGKLCARRVRVKRGRLRASDWRERRPRNYKTFAFHREWGEAVSEKDKGRAHDGTPRVNSGYDLPEAKRELT